MSRVEYPEYVCQTCGYAWGRFPKLNRISCWHNGQCGICSAVEVPVTEPRDFGHLRKGWQNEATQKEVAHVS